VSRVLAVLAAGLIACSYVSVNPATVVDGGDFDVEGAFHAYTGSYNGGLSPFTAFIADTPEGELSLKFDGIQWFLKVRGVAVLDNTPQLEGVAANLGWRAGDDVKWRTWYRPSIGQAGIRIWVNGVQGRDITTTTTGGALAAPTSAVAFADTFTAHGLADVPTAFTPEFVLVGDSTSASWVENGIGDGCVMTLAHKLYTVIQRATRPGIGTIAVQGATAEDQLTSWLASAWRHQTGIKAFLVQVGINNLGLYGQDAPTAAGHIQSLVNQLRADQPSAKIVIAEMIPIRGWTVATWPTDGGAHFATWQAINADIMGTGANPITGVDVRLSASESLLDDGTGDMIAAYKFGDGIHQNNLARDLVGGVYRTTLQTLGVLR
jgi:hypothetical protein